MKDQCLKGAETAYLNTIKNVVECSCPELNVCDPDFNSDSELEKPEPKICNEDSSEEMLYYCNFYCDTYKTSLDECEDGH